MTASPTLFPVAWQPPPAPATLPRYPAAPPSDLVKTIRITHAIRGAK